jgi:protein-disulfide isomerase
MQTIAQLGGMTEFFASRGISRDQAATCLADSAKADALAKQTETASTRYQVTGTPTFFINAAPVGTADWATLEPKLQAAGAR